MTSDHGNTIAACIIFPDSKSNQTATVPFDEISAAKVEFRSPQGALGQLKLRVNKSLIVLNHGNLSTGAGG